MTDAAAAALASRVSAWLPRARWFAAKDRGSADVAVVDSAVVPGAATILLLRVDEDASGDAWVVPVDARTGDDAAFREEFVAWLAGAAFAGGSAPGREGSFVGVPLAPRAVAGETRVVGVAPLGGDASNTSLVATLADGGGTSGLVVVKILRRARPGLHPEVEVGRFLAGQTDWRDTPAFLGHVEYRPPAGEPLAIATVHAFEPGCASAWDRFGVLLAAGGDPAAARRLAERLGETTAAMHRALASRPDVPGFALRPATRESRRRTADTLAVRARASLAAARRGAPADLADRVAAIVRREGVILASLERVAAAATTAADIRVHGDYHLGQVLVDSTGSRVMPIDFEGEPGRPFADRREPTSVLRDVAGMCRSFDYLARDLRRRGAPVVDVGPLVTAFLAGHAGQAAGSGWWPADDGERATLHDAFLLEKALYELAYEVANRPDWAEVPLAALEQLVAGQGAEEGGILPDGGPARP